MSEDTSCLVPLRSIIDARVVGTLLKLLIIGNGRGNPAPTIRGIGLTRREGSPLPIRRVVFSEKNSAQGYGNCNLVLDFFFERKFSLFQFKKP